MKWVSLTTLMFVVFVVAIVGCSNNPPRQPGNLCKVFQEKPKWYRGAVSAQKTWGLPVSVGMAFVYRESSYIADAKPPRGKLLWVIPWRRPSSAYGYAQVLNSTWNLYRRAAARPRAERDRFPDAADFVAWYMNRIAEHAEIEKSSTRALYLAYHEGAGGYRRGTHLAKPWLLDASARVEKRAARYRSQLSGCRERLERYRWWWPF